MASDRPRRVYTDAMKLKCPACGQVLSVPDTAAGRVIQCPCGKQLRAPAPAAAATDNSTQPVRRPPPPQPNRRTPGQPPARSTGDAFGEFDELTDSDLRPVRGVSRPGQKVERSRVNEDQLLLKMAGKQNSFENSIEGSHPSTLKAMGGWNFAFAVWSFVQMVCILGLVSIAPVPLALTMAEGGVLIFLIALFSLDILVQALAGTACFLDYKMGWFFLLAAYTSSLVFNLIDLYDQWRFEGTAMAYVIATISVLIGGVFLSYLLSDEVRKFYKTRSEPWKWPVVSMVVGLIYAALLGGGYVLAT